MTNPSSLQPVEVPHPSGVFAEPWSLRKVFALLACFGPAAIVASVSIGAGETIVVVRTGAWASYGLLWLVLLSCLVKGLFITYLLGRYTAISGEHIGHRLVRIPGPRGWVLLTIITLELLGAPPVWAAIGKPCGNLVQYLAQPWLPAGVPAVVWQNLFATIFIALALGLSLGTAYQSLEKQQIIICGILVAGTITGTLMVHPSWSASLAGTLSIGHLPQFPAWTPESAVRYPLLTMATVFAYVGGSVMGYIVYANWVGLHGWGMTGHPEIEALRERSRNASAPDYLPDDPEQARRLRRLIAPLRWDVGMGALVLFIVTTGFMTAGAAVLYPKERTFEGWNLLTNQADIWRPIHPALVWVYYVTVLAALWGTLQALPEIYTRVTQEFFQAIWPNRKWEYVSIQRVVLVYVFVFTMLLVWSNVDFETLTQIAGFLVANLAIALVAIAALYLNFLLPRYYRTHAFVAVGGIVSSVILIVAAAASGWGLWEKVRGLLGL